MSEERILPSEISAKNAYVEPYIVWENGQPIKKHKIVMAKEDIQNMKIHAASQVYHGRWDPLNQEYEVDPRYEGMSKLEVAQHKLMDAAAEGDVDALNKIEDRILGKPKQQVETLNVSATLEDFLEAVAKEEGIAPVTNSSGYIEGEVVGFPPSAGQSDMDI